MLVGDRIEIYWGDEFVGHGSFLRVEGEVLLWFDCSGCLRFSLLGPGLAVRKV